MPKTKTLQLADAKPRGRQLVVELPDDEEVLQDDSELLRVVEELQGIEDCSIRIDRQGEHGRDLTYIDDVPPENFSLKMLKFPPYNGGKFRIRPRRADGTFAKNVVVKVEPAPKAPEVAPAPVAGLPTISNDALAQAMVTGFGRIGDAMARLGELILQSRANTPTPAPPQTMRDLLGDVQVLRELVMPRDSDPLGMLDKLLGVVEKLPALRGGDGDGGGGAPRSEMDVLYELVRNYAPKILEAVGSQANQQPAPVPRIAPLPADRAHTPTLQPRPTVAPIQQPPQGTPVNPAQMGIAFLVDQARRGNNPEPYAVMVLDNVPAAVVDRYVNDENWFAELEKLSPAVAPHREWFERLRGHVAEYLTNDGDGEDTGGVDQIPRAGPTGAPPNAPASPGS